MDNANLNQRIIWDMKLLGISFLSVFFIYKIVFLNESITNTILLVSGIYWLLIIPAFGITYLIEEIDFLERLIISIPLSAALVGISSYYLGILGFPAIQSAFYVPAIFAVASAGIVFIKSKKPKEAAVKENQQPA